MKAKRSQHFKILQLKNNDDNKRIMFVSYDTAIKNKPDLSINDYDVVYDGDIQDEDDELFEDTKTLNELFYIFNKNRPEDFKGHSLSVSDVIKLGAKFYYVDSFGFREMDHFAIDYFDKILEE